MFIWSWQYNGWRHFRSLNNKDNNLFCMLKFTFDITRKCFVFLKSFVRMDQKERVRDFEESPFLLKSYYTENVHNSIE